MPSSRSTPRGSASSWRSGSRRGVRRARASRSGSAASTAATPPPSASSTEPGSTTCPARPIASPSPAWPPPRPSWRSRSGTERPHPGPGDPMTTVQADVGTDVARLAHKRKWDELRDVLARMHPADVADVIIALPSEDEGIVFRLLPHDRAARAFAYLPRPQQQELVRSLSQDQLRAILDGIAPDDRTR